MTTPSPAPGTIALISLGCPQNLVNSAEMAALLQEEKWILDGDYSRTYEPRIRACDTAIFLDYDEAECMKGITERVGKVRPDMPWTEQEIDPELVEMVRTYRTEKRPLLMDLFRKYPPRRLIVFRTREHASKWLEGLQKKLASTQEKPYNKE